MYVPLSREFFSRENDIALASRMRMTNRHEKIARMRMYVFARARACLCACVSHARAT